MSNASIIAENVARLRERIRLAANRSGRDEQAVRFIAVTKYASLDAVQAVLDAGCTDLGESRPQELWTKAAALSAHKPTWHFIGHLQRNKVRRTLPLVSLMHSIDSLRVLQAIDSELGELHSELEILLEVNISGDASKHGFQPAAMEETVLAASGCKNVRVQGLMTMASLEGDLDDARRDFANLRELRDRLQRNIPQGVSLHHLSMGMSGDYEAAIEEGATMVRIGSSLFEGTHDAAEP